MNVAVMPFTNYADSIKAALDAVGAGPVLQQQKRIVLKPNLVNDEPHPITTPPECVEAVIDYCRAHSDAQVAVAEGCGGLDTMKAFRTLGYVDLARRKRVELVDLDSEETVLLENNTLKCLPQFHMPRFVQDCFLISIPILKAHSMSQVTLSLKNMFGIAPAKYYAGPGFRKAQLHGKRAHDVHRYIVDLNRYRKPDLSVLDATLGMAEAHLWGRRCSPPVNKVLAGLDPVAVDAVGARLLGFDWRRIEHLRLADGVLGTGQTAEA